MILSEISDWQTSFGTELYTMQTDHITERIPEKKMKKKS